ncbi:MAG: hypothetical protein V4510_01625 [bacterium]
MRLAFSLLVILAFAGCASVPPPAAPQVSFDPHWSEKALATGEGHDHADPLQHLNLTTPNFTVLGHDSLNSPYYGGPPGATLCGDAGQAPNGRRIAAVESRSNVGFSLADVTNATHPVWLGELVMENTRVYDLAVVPDGAYVVLVTANLENTPVGLPILDAAPRMTWRSPCAPEHEVQRVGLAATTAPIPAPAQVLLVDISDPANPTIVDGQPISGYGHSVFSTAIDGRTWLLVSTLGPFPPAVPAQATSGWEFYELQATPLGVRLHLLSTYYVRGDLVTSVGQFAHDGAIAKHSGTGQTLGYLVGGDRVTIVDLADPSQPRELSHWSDVVATTAGHSGNFHSVVPLDRLWNGRHYTVVGPEFGNHPDGAPSGIVWVLDTTDPGKPHEVAGWTLPHDPEWSGEYMFSDHYFGVGNKTLYVSMYHGGIWAVDLSPVLDATRAGFRSLDSIGVFMPVDAAVHPAVKVRWAPTLEEALVYSDGVLVTFDSFTGLWTVRFDAEHPAPPPAPWPLVPPHGY